MQKWNIETSVHSLLATDHFFIYIYCSMTKTSKKWHNRSSSVQGSDFGTWPNRKLIQRTDGMRWLTLHNKHDFIHISVDQIVHTHDDILLKKQQPLVDTIMIILDTFKRIVHTLWIYIEIVIYSKISQKCFVYLPNNIVWIIATSTNHSRKIFKDSPVPASNALCAVPLRKLPSFY